MRYPLGNLWATRIHAMPATDIKDTKLSGLYLRKRQGGNVWVVKAKQRGTSRVVTVTLGRADVVKVTQARDMAKPHLVALGTGEDPNLNKKRKAQAHQELGITLQGALDDYLGLGQRQPSTVKSYRQVMQRAFKDWLSWPIRNITRTDVLTRYKDIQKNVSKSSKWTQQANPKGLAEAQKAMRYLTAILNSYLQDRAGGELVLPEGNPANVLKEKRARITLKSRERFLEHAERQTLFEELGHIYHPQYEGSIKPIESDFVLLLMVTGLRINEARALQWINVKEDTFTVLDTKNHSDHTLPITKVVGEILERRRNNTAFVFPGRNGDKPASMDKVINRVTAESGVNFTAHDLRRTAATIAAEYGFTHDQIAKLLNHKKKGVTDRYVQRTAEAMKPVMQAIEDDILMPIEVDPDPVRADSRGKNVVQFRKAKT